MIRVESPGLFTTVQDLGRWGHQHQGVPVAGPMDPFAHRLANLAVGNDASCATLETTLVGPRLRFAAAARFAVAGATCAMTLDGRPVVPGVPHEAPEGSELAIGRVVRGARAYVAVAGGIDVPLVLGSRSTHVPSGMGGVDGRPLKTGDVLRVGLSSATPGLAIEPAPLPDGGAVLRVLPGPEADAFEPDGVRVLARTRLVLHQDSNRMGYRLTGVRLSKVPANRLSSATTMGTIQVPPDGAPILLMADRQTTGGYPRIAHVIAADFGMAGQLKPGDWIEFFVCSADEARAALHERERSVRPRP
jgi:antagonist of KipI